ncbi:MAG TPA: rhomboid family intramembrane serine protease [Gemmatimonadaceae bacterium]|nr:rhomboid family intramembrane serine protease [Gemmatimonadaceae bacterium]
MIPIGDENPTLRTPVATYATLAAILVVWVVVQGMGSDFHALTGSVCNWGLVPGELTHQARLGTSVPLGRDPNGGFWVCSVDNERKNLLTPLTSMFLHGSWGHLIGNSIFLWIFGNNVEDSMGRIRFVLFYLICGLAAAATHVMLDPASPVPTVGASGAISGVMGAYLVLYPHARVKMLVPPFIFWIFRIPAWLVLIYWFGVQLLTGLPQLMPVRPDVSGGVAVWAHVGGFVAGALLIKVFEDRSLVRRRMVAGDAKVAFTEPPGRFQ